MRFSPFYRRLLFPVQVALALLGCSGVFAADAKAECGDYVRILGADGNLTPTIPVRGRDPAGPCRGPTCDHRAPPIAPPTPAAAGPQTQFDAILPEFNPTETALSAHVCGGSGPVPMRFASPLFRPPRPTSVR